MERYDFNKLEERIKQVASLIKQLRLENNQLREQQNARPAHNVDPNLNERVKKFEERIQSLEEENRQLRGYKQTIKTKVEAMLSKYEILDL